MNNVIIIGRLTADAETTKVNEGTTVTRFNVAVNRNYKNKEGVIEADFFNVVAWNKLGENVQQYVKKGDQVAVEGRLETRNYDSKEGFKRYVTEIIANNVTFLNKVYRGE